MINSIISFYDQLCGESAYDSNALRSGIQYFVKTTVDIEVSFKPL